MGRHPSGTFLKCEKQGRRGVLEPPGKKMTHSYGEIMVRPPLKWVEAHRGFEMADPDVGLSSPQP